MSTWQKIQLVLLATRMKLLEIPVTIPKKIHHLLQPIVADVRWLDADRLGEDDKSAWQTLIEETLKEWQRDPGALDEDDLEPPTLAILPVVIEVAKALRDNSVDPPLRVVPNGEGGVVFEWRDRPWFWSLEVEHTGLLTLSLFRDGRLISRHQLS
jgi:hypothetical protein